MNKTRETGLPQFNQFSILQSTVMEIITLPLSEVLALDDVVVFMPNYSELDFDKEWEAVRDSLREKLALKWKESCYGDADFLIGDDRTNSWTQAGSIQNTKMLSSHLSKTIFDVRGFAFLDH